MVTASEYAERAINMILPPRCAVTGEIVDVQGMIAPTAWSRLDFIASPFCTCCGIPFSFDNAEEGEHEHEHGKCMECLNCPPPFNSARSAVVYNDASRDLILAFKHGDKTHLVKNLTPWLHRAGSKILQETDILIPVPLHLTRLISRRYNQAALITHELSKNTGIEHLPLALKRMRATQSQGHLKNRERAENVHKAFSLCPKHREKLNGKTIALIDDVYTTGATVKECCKILKQYGAAKTHVLTIARVLKT